MISGGTAGEDCSSLRYMFTAWRPSEALEIEVYPRFFMPTWRRRRLIVLSSTMRTLCMGASGFNVALPLRGFGTVVVATDAGASCFVVRPWFSEVDVTDMLRLAVAVVTTSSCDDDVETIESPSGIIRERSKQARSARESLYGPIGCRTSSIFLLVAMFFEAVLRRTKTFVWQSWAESLGESLIKASRADSSTTTISDVQPASH